MLYENQNIYIVSSVGDQAKQTFTVLESLITRVGKSAASIKSLQDIAEKETVKSNTNKTGFSHNPAGYEVEFYNGSKIFTLNSNPDSARSRKFACIFDEAAFCSDNLITVCEAFGTQDSSFSTSTDGNYNPEAEKDKFQINLFMLPLKTRTQLYFINTIKILLKECLPEIGIILCVI